MARTTGKRWAAAVLVALGIVFALFGSAAIAAAVLPDTSHASFHVPSGSYLYHLPLAGFYGARVTLSYNVSKGSPVVIDIMNESDLVQYVLNGVVSGVLASTSGYAGVLNFTFHVDGTLEMVFTHESGTPGWDTWGNVTSNVQGANLYGAAPGLGVVAAGCVAFAGSYLLWEPSRRRGVRVRRATVCPTCAALPAPGAKFCRECGTDLRIRPEPLPPEEPGSGPG